MKKQPEITAFTKKNIIEAFWKLYCQKRIDKITIKELSNLAGYNRATFYEYFTDIYDVLEQIENELLPTLDRLPFNDIKQSHSSAFNALFKYYEENSKYLIVLLGEHGDPSFLPKMKKAIAPVIKSDLLQKGAKESFELDVLIEYNISAMLGIFNLWFTTENKPPLDEFIKYIYAVKSKGETKILSELIN